MFLFNNFRALSSIVVLISIILLAAAYYFEYAEGLEPCPMCIMQRIVVFVLGWVALIAAIHNPDKSFGRRVYASVAGLFSLLGVALAARQSWIQIYPPEDIPTCGAPLEYMLELMPFMEVLSAVLTGTASCTEISWEFLGLTMPNWMILAFIGYLIYSILAFKSKSVDKVE